MQLPHSYDEGSDLEPHVHFIPTTNGAGNVSWGLEYTWANVNDTFPVTVLITGVTAVTINTLLKHYICELPTMSGTGKKISSMLMCRVYRNVGGESPGAYNAGAGLLEIDFHYRQCGVGSTQQYFK